jgi:hypothetical protein
MQVPALTPDIYSNILARKCKYFFLCTKQIPAMKPLKIFFKIIKTGNGKFLATKNEVNNLIVDVINRNPSQSSAGLREIAIQELNSKPASQQVLKTNEYFFIDTVTDIEIVITYLPQEKILSEQFYTQWRYVQISSPYRLIQYLDETRVVVYSEKTKVLHTIKLDKTVTVVVDED